MLSSSATVDGNTILFDGLSESDLDCFLFYVENIREKGKMQEMKSERDQIIKSLKEATFHLKNSKSSKVCGDGKNSREKKYRNVNATLQKTFDIKNNLQKVINDAIFLKRKPILPTSTFARITGIAYQTVGYTDE